MCEENGVPLIYFTDSVKYNEFLGEKLIKNNNDLLELIKEYGKKG